MSEKDFIKLISLGSSSTSKAFQFYNQIQMVHTIHFRNYSQRGILTSTSVFKTVSSHPCFFIRNHNFIVLLIE